MADENKLSDLARRAAAGADMIREAADADQLSKQQIAAELASIKSRLTQIERAIAQLATQSAASLKRR